MVTEKDKPKIEEITLTVSLSAEKAGVAYDPAACSVEEMERAISDIGYEVPLSKVDLLVLGMTPGHCDIIIGDALRTEAGVRSVVVNPATDTVTVEFLESLLSAGAIKKIIRGLGYEVHD